MEVQPFVLDELPRCQASLFSLRFRDQQLERDYCNMAAVAGRWLDRHILPLTLFLALGYGFKMPARVELVFISFQLVMRVLMGGLAYVACRWRGADWRRWRHVWIILLRSSRALAYLVYAWPFLGRCSAQFLKGLLIDSNVGLAPVPLLSPLLFKNHMPIHLVTLAAVVCTLAGPCGVCEEVAARAAAGDAACIAFQAQAAWLAHYLRRCLLAVWFDDGKAFVQAVPVSPCKAVAVFAAVVVGCVLPSCVLYVAELAHRRAWALKRGMWLTLPLLESEAIMLGACVSLSVVLWALLASWL